MVFVEFFTEIELDRRTLENSLRLASGLVYDGGNTAICCGFTQLSSVISRERNHTVDLEEPVFLLRVFGNVDVVRGILDAEFFEGDADFVAIGRAVRVSDLIVSIIALN